MKLNTPICSKPVLSAGMVVENAGGKCGTGYLSLRSNKISWS